MLPQVILKLLEPIASLLTHSDHVLLAVHKLVSKVLAVLLLHSSHN